MDSPKLKTVPPKKENENENENEKEKEKEIPVTEEVAKSVKTSRETIEGLKLELRIWQTAYQQQVNKGATRIKKVLEEYNLREVEIVSRYEKRLVEFQKKTSLRVVEEETRRRDSTDEEIRKKSMRIKSLEERNELLIKEKLSSDKLSSQELLQRDLLKKELESLKTKNEDLKNENEKVLKRVQAVEVGNQRLLKEMEKKRKVISELDDELTRIRGVKIRYQELRKRNVSLSALLGNREEEVTRLKGCLSEEKKNSAVVNLENSELRKKVFQAESKGKSLKILLAQNEKLINLQTKKMTDEKSSFLTQEKANEKLRGVNSELRDENLRLSKDNESLVAKIVSLKSEVGKMDEFCGKVQKTSGEKLGVYSSRIKELQGANRGLQKDLEGCKRKIMVLSKEKKEKDGKDGSDVENDKLRNENLVLRDKLIEMSETMLRTKQEVAKTRSGGETLPRIEKTVAGQSTIHPVTIQEKEKDMETSRNVIDQLIEERDHYKTLLKRRRKKERGEASQSSVPSSASSAKLQEENLMLRKKYQFVKDRYIRMSLRQNELQSCLLRMSRYKNQLGMEDLMLATTKKGALKTMKSSGKGSRQKKPSKNKKGGRREPKIQTRFSRNISRANKSSILGKGKILRKQSSRKRSRTPTNSRIYYSNRGGSSKSKLFMAFKK